MTLYDVSATVSFIGTICVEADTPEAALEEAREFAARDFEFDPDTGDVEFNVTPAVEEV